MHAVAVQIAPLLAAEKSKTAFYIVGGLLVVWAFVLALGIGMRRPNFPANRAAERRVIAISVTLVAATVATAVLTSSPPAKSEAATVAPTSTVKAPIAPKAEPEPSAPASTTRTSAPATTTPAPVVTRLGLSVPSTAFAYNTKQLTASAGTVLIALTNKQPIEHNLSIEQGGKVIAATPTFMGGTKALMLTLKPGTYKFFCSVPGHRQAGMEGTLTVK